MSGSSFCILMTTTAREIIVIIIGWSHCWFLLFRMRYKCVLGPEICIYTCINVVHCKSAVKMSVRAFHQM